jgi:prepilin-type processing-associated H-X9-DG protein
VQAAWVNANASYVYKGAGKNNATPADVVVLYEKPDNHDEDGVNFLYGDGHVEWQSMPVAQQEIQKAGGAAPPR